MVTASFHREIKQNKEEKEPGRRRKPTAYENGDLSEIGFHGEWKKTPGSRPLADRTTAQICAPSWSTTAPICASIFVRWQFVVYLKPKDTNFQPPNPKTFPAFANTNKKAFAAPNTAKHHWAGAGIENGSGSTVLAFKYFDCPVLP